MVIYLDELEIRELPLNKQEVSKFNKRASVKDSSTNPNTLGMKAFQAHIVGKANTNTNTRISNKPPKNLNKFVIFKLF